MSGFEPGVDVVWIGPGKWDLPGRHKGYPMSIVDAQQIVNGGQYVNGRVLLDNGDPTDMIWLLLLPLNQPRARFHRGLGQYVPPWGPPPPAVGRVAAPAHAVVAPEPAHVAAVPSPAPDYQAAADAFLHHRSPRFPDAAGHQPYPR